MAFKLSVYTANCYRDYLLPSENNTDYNIRLNKNEFGIDKDVLLRLENIENEWYYKPGKGYKLLNDRQTGYEGKIGRNNVTMLVTDKREKLTIITQDISKSLDMFAKLDISGISKLSIGKSDSNEIRYTAFDYISKIHAVMERRADGWHISDQSINGIYINTHRLEGRKKLLFGDIIHIFGLQMIFCGELLAVNTRIQGVSVDKRVLREYYSSEFGKDVSETDRVRKKLFHRAPRHIKRIYDEKIEIEAPPEPKPIDRKPLFMTIGPSFTMALPMLLGCGMAALASQSSGTGAGTFMYTGIITAVTSAIVGVFWALMNLRYASKNEELQEEHRFDAYSNYLVEIADNVENMYRSNYDVMNEEYPAAELCSSYKSGNPLLWNRNFTHKDVLYHRLGIGTLPFQVQIEPPKKKFTLVNDDLAKKPYTIRDNYQNLMNVPVGIDLLENKLIGIIGGERKRGAIETARALSIVIAASNCYTDVKLGFVYDKSRGIIGDEWSFAKWLPHVWSEDRKTRFVAESAHEASDVFFELAKIMRIREENAAESNSKDEIVKPHYILFVEDPALLSGELVSKYVYAGNEIHGLTTVVLVERYEDLPNVCECVIQNDDDFCGVYNVKDSSGLKQEIVMDSVSAKAAENFAREICGMEVGEIESGVEIPNSLTFFDMYGVNSLEEFDVMNRWRKNRTYDSMKAIIGVKAGGELCALDIHEKYHGPHGLVAGTTGSGKSETLQTYILSLAINFSPNDVGFFVIDFKGGGMANLFTDLPHMIGQISNLSGNQVRRAMVSIKSENMRRQRIFTEHGVNNINLYTRLVKNNEASIPIPHLFIIIDEFAELKKEEPEFMRELISVAQVGRSLGVHLILATQKPSGTVDDNIWSNSKFRLCLRVQDRQDSNDMLHKPDAAYITQAGRGYLQVGNDEVYEYFQSGWSGAEYDAENANAKTEIANMISNTGKTTIIGSRTKIKRKEAQRKKWLAALVGCIEGVLDVNGLSRYDFDENDNLTSDDISGIYASIAKTGYEYEETKFNTARLEDFFRAWTSCESDDTNEQVDEIVTVAQTSGLKLPEIKEHTQLEAVVEYLKETAEKNGYNYNLKLWLPVLPTEMYLSDLQGYDTTAYKDGSWPMRDAKQWTLDVVVGLYDDPENQAQKPVVVDFAKGGHHALCGQVVSGKSTFLQTLVYSLITKYTPQQVNIYAIDFSSKMLGSYENAPHVGGVMYENTLDRIDKFFNMIFRILEERKKLFKGGSYSQYVRSHGFVIPSIIVVIDNYANFREKTNDKYGDDLIQLVKNGEGNGIFFIMSGGGFGIAEIPNRIADNLRSVVCLEMGDKFKFGDVLRTMHFDVLPEEDVRGRGLIPVDGRILEFHTALARKAQDDYMRLEDIKTLCEDMREHWSGETAYVVPEIPEEPTIDHLSSLRDYETAIKDNELLPFAYSQEDASVYSLSLRNLYTYVIAGKAKTGKTNTLKCMVIAALKKSDQVYIIDSASTELKRFCSSYEKIRYVNTNDDDMFDAMKSITDVFASRTKERKSYMNEGYDDSEIFDRMSRHEPVFVFINDLQKFTEMLYSQDGRGKDVVGALEQLLEHGKLHGVYFIGCMNPDKNSKVIGLKAYDTFVSRKQGILMGGNAASQNFFEFGGLSFAALNAVYKPGIGMVPPEIGGMGAKIVVVPEVGRKKK